MCVCTGVGKSRFPVRMEKDKQILINTIIIKSVCILIMVNLPLPTPVCVQGQLGHSIKISKFYRSIKKIKVLCAFFPPQNHPSMAEERQRPVLAQHLPHNGL